MELSAQQARVESVKWDRFALACLRRGHWFWLSFFILSALALRLILVLTHPAYLGIDGGAYVLSALRVQGLDHTSVGFPRPPLAPGWLLVPFINSLGIDTGYKVFAATTSLLPLLPTYLLTRHLAGKGPALFAVAFLAVDISHMEMTVTGSLPLIGFTCIGLAIWAIIELSQGWSRLHFFTLVLSLGILPYINQTAAGMALYILPIFVLALFTLAHIEKGKGDAVPVQVNLIFFVLPAAALGLLIACGALPWYLANMPGNSELRYPGPLITFVQWHDPALWLHFPIAEVTAFLLWRSTKDYRLRSLALLLAVLGIVVLFLSYDEAVVNLLFRPRFFMALLVYPAIAYLLKNLWPFKWQQDKFYISAMAVVWLYLFMWWQPSTFLTDTGFKDQILPETKAALDIAKIERPGQAIITNAYSMSHWVAALNDVESPNTWSVEPSPYYKASDEQVRCLLGWVADCSPQLAAQSLNAGYILIDTRMPDEILADPVYGRISDDEWANLPDVPWLSLRYSKKTIQLWEVHS